MLLFSILVHYLWAVNSARSAPLRPPHASVPDASSLAICYGTAAMILFAASAVVLIFLQLAPARPGLALM